MTEDKFKKFGIHRLFNNILIGRTIKRIGFNKDNKVEYIDLTGEDGKVEIHLDHDQFHIHDFRGSTQTMRNEDE